MIEIKGALKISWKSRQNGSFWAFSYFSFPTRRSPICWIRFASILLRIFASMKRCSTSLLIREIQIKTTLRYHLMPIRVAKMNKSGDYRCWRGYGETGTLLHCWWDCKLVRPLWKTVWRFLKKELPYDPAIALLGIYPKDTQMLIYRSTCTPMFIAALPTIAKLWKET